MAGTETPLDGGNMNNGVVRVGDTVRRPAGPWTPSPGAQWQVLIPADGNEIIAHHDLAPQPLVIGDSEWAFIDWDTAGPGTRLWDLAYAMHGFAPLTADPALQRDDASHRLRVIADAYDLTQQQRLDIIPLLPRRTQAMHDFLARQAAQGTQPWTRTPVAPGPHRIARTRP
jgi:Ser/Thr protein kinase RdoA (MazF antagonist)